MHSSWQWHLEEPVIGTCSLDPWGCPVLLPHEVQVWPSLFLWFTDTGPGLLSHPTPGLTLPLPGSLWATTLPNGVSRVLSASLELAWMYLLGPHLNLVSNLPDSASMLPPTSHFSLLAVHCFLTFPLAQDPLSQLPLMAMNTAGN